MKKRSLWILVLAVAAVLAFYACGEDDDTEPAVGDNQPTTDGDDDTSEAADDAEEEATDPGDEEGIVGAACEANDDCDDGYCLNAEQLAADFAGIEASIPNGYCSKYPCLLSGDETCNSANHGYCFSWQPIFGEVAPPGIDLDPLTEGLCVKVCNSAADCRAEDDMSCVDPAFWLDLGYISQDTFDSFYQGTKFCLPADLENEITAAFEAQQNQDTETEE